MDIPLNGMDNNRHTDKEKPRVGSPELHPLMAINTPGTVEAGNGSTSRLGAEKNTEVFSDVTRGGGIDDGLLTPTAGGDGPGVPATPRHPDREEGSEERGRHHPFPPTPGFPPDVDKIPRGRGGVDINVYAHKKTLAQGMMDLALLSANANQLRYVLDTGSDHPYYYLGVVFISMSILLQLAVGIGLILNSRYNIRHIRDVTMANKINNFTVLGIFLVTMMNVFISAFGVGNMPSDVGKIPPERLSRLLALNNCTE